MRSISSRIALGLLIAALFSPHVGFAQPDQSSGQGSALGEVGKPWSSLNSTTQAALAPLQTQWASLSVNTKEKWLGVAQRMAGMAQPDRERIQARMSDWAKLTPLERGQTRLFFQEALRVAPEARSEQWRRYNELSDDEKRQLAAKAVPSTSARPVSAPQGGRAAFSVSAPVAANKINTTPASSSVPERIAPSVLQAQPGATTTLITSTPKPPAHQPAGSPKIVGATRPEPPPSSQ